MKGRYLGNFKDMNDVSDNFDFNGYHEEGDYITISKKIYIYDNMSKSFSEVEKEVNDDKNKDKIIIKGTLNNLDELNHLNKEDLKEGDLYIINIYERYNICIYRESIKDFEISYLQTSDFVNELKYDNIQYHPIPVRVPDSEENDNVFIIILLLFIIAQLSYIILHI